MSRQTAPGALDFMIEAKPPVPDRAASTSSLRCSGPEQPLRSGAPQAVRHRNGETGCIELALENTERADSDGRIGFIKAFWGTRPEPGPHDRSPASGVCLTENDAQGKAVARTVRAAQAARDGVQPGYCASICGPHVHLLDTTADSPRSTSSSPIFSPSRTQAIRGRPAPAKIAAETRADGFDFTDQSAPVSKAHRSRGRATLTATASAGSVRVRDRLEPRPRPGDALHR